MPRTVRMHLGLLAAGALAAAAVPAGAAAAAHLPARTGPAAVIPPPPPPDPGGGGGTRPDPVPVLKRTRAVPRAGSPWQPLTHHPSFNPGAMIQLTDGTVLVQSQGPGNNGTNKWWRLKPSATGSYVNGTWSQAAALPSNYAPLYYPAGSPQPGWLPKITTAPATLTAGSSYTLTGRQLNGLTRARPTATTTRPPRTIRWCASPTPRPARSPTRAPPA
jgi:hypothetical protein